MASNIDINLNARTSDFESAIQRVTKSFENLAYEGKDASKALESSFKSMGETTTTLQKAFNSLSIKTDFNLDVQKESLVRNAHFFTRQFLEIRDSGKASAAEISRAYEAMHAKIATMNAASPQGKIDASIQANLKAAQEASDAKLQQINKLRAASVDAEVQSIIAAEKAAAAKIVAAEKEAATRTAAYIKMYDEAVMIENKRVQAAQAAIAKQLESMNALHAEAIYIEERRTQAAQKAAAQRVLIEQEAIAKQKAAMERLYDEAVYMNNKRNAAAQEAAAQARAQALPNAYKGLGVKSDMDISAERAKIIANLDMIRNSGTATFGDIKRAAAAAKIQLEDLANVADGKVMDGHNESMKAFSFATIGMIVKIQVLYSLVNQLMSAVGQFPGQAIAAVEDYKSSIIANAAIITSMQVGVKDVGKEYQKNKIYAEGVQNVLIKMDANTSAGLKNLQDMNDKFQQQGVLIDARNKKQKEGFLDLANYLAVVSKTSSNKDQQFPQEINSLQDFSSRPGNKLVQYLESQGVTKKMLEEWKEFGRVTQNNGYLFEKLGPYFSGFREAQKDINGLLETAKSTLITIYTEVLRGGMTPAVEELNKKMNELVNWAKKHEDQIISGINKGWLTTKGTIESVTNLLKIMNPVMQEGDSIVGKIIKGWSLIGAVALPVVTEELTGLIKVLNAIMNMVYEIGLGFINFVGTMGTGIVSLGKAVVQAGKGDFAAAGKTLGDAFSGAFANNLTANMAGVKGAALTIAEEFNRPTSFDKRMADWNKSFVKGGEGLGGAPSNIGGKKGAGTGTATTHEANPLIEKWNSMLRKEKSGVSELDDKLRQNAFDFQKFLDEFEKSDQKKYLKSQGITEKSIKNKKLEFDNQIRAIDYEKRMVKLAQEGEMQIASDKAVFALKISTGELGSYAASEGSKKLGPGDNYNPNTRYKVTPLSKYGLNTSFYGIKQQAPAFAQDKYNVDRMKEEFANANAQQSAWGGDNYGSKLAKAQADFTLEKANLQSQYDEKLIMKEEFDRKMLASEQKYAAEKNSLGLSTMSDSIALMRQAFAGNKAMMIAAMILEKSIAIARIMMNTEVAASAAIAAAAMIPVGGVAIGQANAAAIRTMSYVSIGMVLASGAMEGMQIAGAREFGGPVTAGQSYIVGEKRPELFTPGASGVITPYVPSTGQGITINQSFNITGVGAEIMTNVKTVAKQAADAAKNEILNSMNRGSEFALASGRMK